MKTSLSTLFALLLAMSSAQADLAAHGSARVSVNESTGRSKIVLGGKAAELLYAAIAGPEFPILETTSGRPDSRQKNARDLTCTQNLKKKGQTLCELSFDPTTGEAGSPPFYPGGPVHSPSAGGSSR